jgi:hypothetical protein
VRLKFDQAAFKLLHGALLDKREFWIYLFVFSRFTARPGRGIAASSPDLIDIV